jgi:hypothetical protein
VVLLFALIIIFVTYLYLSYLNIMQVFTNKHSDNILNKLNNNNLKYVPNFLKPLLSKILTNFFNLHRTFYKYFIFIAIILIIFNLLLSIFITVELITNLDQYVEVYKTYPKR